MPESPYSQGVAVCSVSILSLKYLFYNLVKKFVPVLEMRMHGGPFFSKLSNISSYNVILSISSFTQKWVGAYWGKESNILFPPVSVENFYSSDSKKNHIAHVGRFFVGGHSKGQLEMVRAFKQLYDSGHKDWEMHFVGSVGDEQSNKDYLQKCRDEATEYPIFFHVNVPFSRLREILALAKIYWHATGINLDENKAPINMEHFGIATVEAMAAGCVPVVIGKGGQREVVPKGTGYLWETTDELLEHTQKLMGNKKLLSKMSLAARKSSQYFAKKEFVKRFRKYLEENGVI
jgi:glycosyltransferase involved in cell wall biosynthesis